MTKNVRLKTYTCKGCGRETEILYLPTMSKMTFKVFNKMLKAEMCRDCYCEERVPETANILMEAMPCFI